ncbi:hypothetical protein CPB85DRAFT_1440819 [Mucidula mucida]|nr:hypothetical protein CPB85DRAFT_1440819 [Mucidula mucida]
MPPSISLSQISTRLPHRLSKTLRYSFTPSRADVDCTEYCLGLNRGEIGNVDSRLLVTTVQDDMVSLLQRGQWTLLPPRHTLEKIRDLYIRNHENGTFNRTEFLEAIPEGDYDYQFLCLSLPHHRQWHVDGVACPFPVEDFPPVQTRIHPCFFFQSLMKFMVRGPQDESHLKPMRDLVDICDRINFTRIRSVYVSWLLDAKYHFPERLTPFARRDLPEHLPPPGQSAPSIEEPPASRPAGSKRVRITSPPKSIFKRAGTSTKKVVLKASSSKATLCRKPPAKKRTVSQLSTNSAEEELPLKPRRSPRFAQS